VHVAREYVEINEGQELDANIGMAKSLQIFLGP
jgi:hypothetical protein